MSEGQHDIEAEDDPRPYGLHQWLGTLLGGAGAIFGGTTGCLAFLLLLLAPLLVFLLIFSQGLLSIFER